MNLHPFQSPKLNKNPLPSMRKADNLRMFKTDGTKLTEIRVKIDLGRIADGVVVGFDIGDGG